MTVLHAYKHISREGVLHAYEHISMEGVLHAYEHISSLSKCSSERSNLCMCGLDWMYKTAKGSS